MLPCETENKLPMSTANGNNFGGLLGSCGGNPNAVVNRSYSTGTVNGYNNAGGFIGFLGRCYIDQSYATGNVNGRNQIGGFGDA